MRFSPLIVAVVVAFYCSGIRAEISPFTFEQGMDVQLKGVTWLRTMFTPFHVNDPESHYKVYTHLYDFEGSLPITKGDGGKYPHHRGLFIGWNKTQIGERTVDSWSRPDSAENLLACQQWVEWTALTADAESATQTARIHWGADGDTPFLEESRTLRAVLLGENLRAVDFKSVLSSLGDTIILRGDPQHAGMHVRMAQEVAENEAETHYILPGKVKVLDDDVVEGAWWVCASMPVRGKRYWVMHMTSPDLSTGVPLYSIRPYGRFGAFFESTIEKSKPLTAAFRVIWTNIPLDQTRCEELYQQYALTVEQSVP